MVIATQNPVDQEGTYRLPESQLDRFLLRIALGYPGRAAEMSILDGRGAIESLTRISPVASSDEVMTMIEAVRSVYMADALKAYLVDIAEASRRHPAVEFGLSPRATLQLAAAAKAHAAARGRRYATPDDIKAVAVPALAHRLLLRTDRGGRLDPVDAVGEILADVVVPTARCVAPTGVRRARAPPASIRLRRSSLTMPAGRPRPAASGCERLTRQGWTVLVGAVLCVVVGRLFGIIELYVIGAALAAAVVFGFAIVLHPSTAGRGPPVDPTVGVDGRRRRSRRGARAADRAHTVAGLRARRARRRRPDGADGRRPTLAGQRGQRRLPDPDRAPGRADARPADGDPPRRRRGWPARPPRSAASRRCSSRRGRTCSTCRRSAKACSADTCWHSPNASAPATSTACATTSRATSRAPSTGGHRLDPSSSRCASTASRGCVAASSCSTSTCRRGRTARRPSSEESRRPPASSTAPTAPGLTTRFVTTDGADLRGPDVAAQTLHLLARIATSAAPPAPVERDPGEGLGLVVTIAPDESSAAWSSLGRVTDPTLTAVGVFTLDRPPRRGLLTVDARTEEAFLDGWELLAGVGRLDARTRDPLRRDQSRSSGTTRDGDAHPPVDDAARPRRRRWRTPARAPSRAPRSAALAIDLAATIAPRHVLVRRRPRVRPRLRRLGVRR